MSPLNASGVDSQGITYSLNSTTRTATIWIYRGGKYQNGRGYMYETGKHKVAWGPDNTLYFDTRGTTNGYNGNDEGHIDVIQGGNQDYIHYKFDRDGRILLYANTNLCVYAMSNTHITIMDRSLITTTDPKQFWYFNGTNIRSWTNDYFLTKYLDSNRMYLNPTPAASSASNWTFLTVEGELQAWPAAEDKHNVVIRRGVMTPDGTMYKITKVGDGALGSGFIGMVKFPHHRISEMSLGANPFGGGHYSPWFRDGPYTRKLNGKTTQIQFRPYTYTSTAAIDFGIADCFLHIWYNAENGVYNERWRFDSSTKQIYSTLSGYANYKWYCNDPKSDNVLRIMANPPLEKSQFEYDGIFIHSLNFPGWVVALPNAPSDQVDVRIRMEELNCANKLQKWALYEY